MQDQIRVNEIYWLPYQSGEKAPAAIEEIIRGILYRCERFDSVILPTQCVLRAPGDHSLVSWEMGRIYHTNLVLWRERVWNCDEAYDMAVQDCKANGKTWTGPDFADLSLFEVFQQHGTDGHFQLQKVGYRFAPTEYANVKTAKAPGYVNVPDVMIDFDG